MNLQTHELVNLPTYKLTTSQNEQAPSAKRRARGCRMKKGGHLLSRIALQYHRRRRA